MAIKSIHEIKPGDLYFDTVNKKVYFVESYCKEPTVTLKRIDAEDRIDAGISGLAFQDCEPLEIDGKQANFCVNAEEGEE